MQWFIYSIIALIIWGFYGFFPKLTTGYIDPKSAVVFQSVGGIIIGIFVLIFALKFKPEMHFKGILFAILTGIAGVTGALFFLYALSTGGKTAAVVTITALYPLITIALSFFILHETITIVQGIGVLMALAAIVLISV